MIGHCRFCGQSMMTDCETEEAANDYAERNCKCPEGMELRNIEDMKEAAKENIVALFEDEADETIGLMMHCVDTLAAGKVSKVTISIDERTKASLIRTAKDGIQLKKNYKEDFVLEANKF